MDAKARKAIKELLSQPQESQDMAAVALWMMVDIGEIAHPSPYQEELNRLARAVAPQLGAHLSAREKLGILSGYLFGEAGFRGNTQSYYDPRNSFLHWVITERSGIPLTLSMVYLEVGWRCGLPLVGLGFPAHFMVGYQGEELYVDPFNGGAVLSAGQCATQIAGVLGHSLPAGPAAEKPATKPQMLQRLLRNLKAIYLHQKNYARVEWACEMGLLVDPDSSHELRDLGLARVKLGAFGKAIANLESYLAQEPKAPDAERIQHEIKEAVEWQYRMN